MNHKIKLPVKLLILLVCSAPGALLSLPQANQDQDQIARQREAPTYKVQSNLVVVDVTVRDKKGNPIRDLNKGDFTVYEDNVPQQIVTFSLENIPVSREESVEESAPKAQPSKPTVNFGTTPTAERKPEEVQDKRLIILFFDLASLETEDLIRSVETAEDFVSKKSTPYDLLAIATYSSTLQIVQDFTNDRVVLLDALKHLNPTEAGDATQEDLGDPDTSEDDYVPDDTQFNIFNTDRRLSSLETLAKMYREVPVRKSLIYFSSGIETTGIENQSQIRSTVDSANRSNLSIYAVDSRGLVALPPGGAASKGSPRGNALFSGMAMSRQMDNLSSSQETLTTLAHDTGGTAFQDTNQLDLVFTKVVTDTQSYYVLGYYTSNAKEDGKFRRIRVEVNRPELKIQYRPGYFASKQFLKLTQTERDRQLEEALAVDRPFSDLPFILDADYFKEDANSCVVPVSLQLAGEGVQFEEKGNRREAQFEFLAQVTDPKGKVAGVARDIVQVRLPVQKAEKIKAGQILYTTGFQLRPGPYTLKFLIRDNRSGKLGSFEQPLEVPVMDGKKLQTSSIVLGSRLVDTAETSQGVQHSGFGERFRMLAIKSDPLKIEDKRIVPSIGNIFLSRQTLYVYFQVYGAGEDPQTKKPSLETHLMFLKDKSKVLESQPYQVSDWAKDEKGVATVSMAIPLRSLKRGRYALQIHLRDEVNDANLFQRVPLVVD
ncbi:MAG TPA: VWA domain-containing protein [Acidobacteriota bacterium]|nr:VWA domain-containing protein [Acidobacteriota bacterium]